MGSSLFKAFALAASMFVAASPGAQKVANIGLKSAAEDTERQERALLRRDSA